MKYAYKLDNNTSNRLYYNRNTDIRRFCTSNAQYPGVPYSGMMVGNGTISGVIVKLTGISTVLLTELATG